MVAQTTDSGVYELHPKDLFENEGFDKSGSTKVRFIEFSQSGGGVKTSSRFYNFETYDMVTPTVVSRQRDSITVSLKFKANTDKAGLNFLPVSIFNYACLLALLH